MDDVGRILGLLYNAHRCVDGMYFEIRDWRRQEASNVLLKETGVDGTTRLRWAGGGPFATPAITVRRIWFQPPDRVRVEVLAGTRVIGAAVRDQNTWWRWDQQGGAIAGDASNAAGIPPLLDPPLLHPAHLLTGLWFEVTGTARRAGRDVLTATATPRLRTIDDAVAYSELEVDLKHGTPLRIATFDAKGCVSASETLAVDYEPRLDPSIFRFALTVGEQPAPAGGQSKSIVTNGVRKHVSLPPAVGLASRRTVWLTGLSGAGKTTIARTVETLLRQLNVACCVLDGDELREGLSRDLSHSREDRGEQARRAAHIAVLLAQAGVTPIVALVSPYAQDRARVREIHVALGLRLVEVWVDTPLEICAERDMKGLYATAQASPAATNGHHECNGAGLTGVAAPYEPPMSPELIVSGYGVHPREAAARIVELLLSPPAHTAVLPLDGQPALDDAARTA